MKTHEEMALAIGEAFFETSELVKLAPHFEGLFTQLSGVAKEPVLNRGTPFQMRVVKSRHVGNDPMFAITIDHSPIEMNVVNMDFFADDDPKRIARVLLARTAQFYG